MTVHERLKEVFCQSGRVDRDKVGAASRVVSGCRSLKDLCKMFLTRARLPRHQDGGVVTGQHLSKSNLLKHMGVLRDKFTHPCIRQ